MACVTPPRAGVPVHWICRCAGNLKLARAKPIDGFPYALGQRGPRLGRPAQAVHHQQQFVQQLGIPEIVVDLVQKFGHAVEVWMTPSEAEVVFASAA